MAKSRNKPTSQDVAREAGVSQTTVSYVLSGSKHAERISAETKRRIFAAARRLGYSRNSIGAALRRGYSDTLVLLAVTWELASGHSQTIMAVSQAAADRGLTTIVHVATDDAEAITFLENCLSLNPFGMLTLWDSAGKPQGELQALQEQGLPIIDLMPSDIETIPSVTSDRRQGLYQATRHLIELGHKNIGLILDTAGRSTTSYEKLAGYQDALTEAGMPFQESLLQETAFFGFSGGQQGLSHLLDRRPDTTGVLTLNDPMALGAVSLCHDRGLSVPQDLSVIGYAAFREGAYFRPALTTLSLPSRQIARTSVEELWNVRKRDNYEPTTTYIPMELLVRESTAPPREG